MIQPPRGLAGLAFLVLAGVVAWGGTVDPAKAHVRWIFVVALATMAIVSFRFQGPGRIERAYLQMLMLGIAIGSVAWLIPANGSNALFIVGGLLVVVPAGLWITLWFQRRQEGDDADRPR
jgi:hypothetical protein